MRKHVALVVASSLAASHADCEPWCADVPCTQLNGNFRLECGSCSGDEYRCRPACDARIIDASSTSSLAADLAASTTPTLVTNAMATWRSYNLDSLLASHPDVPLKVVRGSDVTTPRHPSSYMQTLNEWPATPEAVQPVMGAAVGQPMFDTETGKPLYPQTSVPKFDVNTGKPINPDSGVSL